MTSGHSKLQSVCVYCGSSPGTDREFVIAAKGLGKSLALNGLRLIYGGGNAGLMGALARSVIDNGGDVTGIIPDFLKQAEQPEPPEGFEQVEMITVPDMHTRKQMMFEHSDAFVALPGGIGTLEELVEMSTWAQLGRHEKPILLLNTKQFWSPYEKLIQHMKAAGFLHTPEKAMPLFTDEVDQVVPMLLASS